MSEPIMRYVAHIDDLDFKARCFNVSIKREAMPDHSPLGISHFKPGPARMSLIFDLNDDELIDTVKRCCLHKKRVVVKLCHIGSNNETYRSDLEATMIRYTPGIGGRHAIGFKDVKELS